MIISSRFFSFVPDLYRPSYILPLARVDPLIAPRAIYGSRDSALDIRRDAFDLLNRTLQVSLHLHFIFLFLTFSTYMYLLFSNIVIQYSSPSFHSFSLCPAGCFIYFFFLSQNTLRAAVAHTTSFSISHFLVYWPYLYEWGGTRSFRFGYLGWTRPRAKSSPLIFVVVVALTFFFGPVRFLVCDSNRAAFNGFRIPQ